MECGEADRAGQGREKQGWGTRRGARDCPPACSGDCCKLVAVTVVSFRLSVCAKAVWLRSCFSGPAGLHGFGSWSRLHVPCAFRFSRPSLPDWN